MRKTKQEAEKRKQNKICKHLFSPNHFRVGFVLVQKTTRGKGRKEVEALGMVEKERRFAGNTAQTIALWKAFTNTSRCYDVIF